MFVGFCSDCAKVGNLGFFFQGCLKIGSGCDSYHSCKEMIELPQVTKSSHIKMNVSNFAFVSIKFAAELIRTFCYL